MGTRNTAKYEAAEATFRKTICDYTSAWVQPRRSTASKSLGPAECGRFSGISPAIECSQLGRSVCRLHCKIANAYGFVQSNPCAISQFCLVSRSRSLFRLLLKTSNLRKAAKYGC